MTNSITGTDSAQELLIKLVEQNPADWETRKKVVKVLYDAHYFRDASKMVWSAPEIPPVGAEVIFAARVVSKGHPSRAMRLFDTVIEKNKSHPEENLAMAKQLVKSGMPHQAIRFYGAATVMDTRLIDENFELSLVAADAGGENWSELVTNDDFPWEGPQVPEVNDGAGTKPVDPYAELLNGATQPVPMKAPVREMAERRAELPHWRVDQKKTSDFSKVMLEEALAKNEQGVQQSWTAAEAAIEEVESGPPAVSPSGQGHQASERKDTLAEFLAGSQPELTDEPKAQPECNPESHPGQNLSASITHGAGAFFRSYDDAHEHKQERQEYTSTAQSGVSPVPPVLRKTETGQVSANEQVSGDNNLADGQATATIAEHVSDLMAQPDASDEQEGGDQTQNELANTRGRKTGAFSSLIQKMLRKNVDVVEREPVINVDDLDLSGVEAVSVSCDDTPEAAPVSGPVKAPVPMTAPDSVQLPTAGQGSPSPAALEAPEPVSKIAVTVAKPGVEQPSIPKELDGRTQLVSLAPEDGSCFFNELRDKYSALQEGELPRPAILARDMANIDYVRQINNACNKDLDAFSKLLGLHRVMSNAGCSEWVDDMNLLRKGYGDAVLATVVSKYSPTECREILNSVYSYPVSEAAM
ncbi:MAG: hypothetical protein H7A51_08790 [Akkermansiaceae bacterium]|nr:hypothetical protein [Akkermansiaceae bacterium]